MKLRNVRKVIFDELTHSYWCGEKELLGVTSLMRKYGLSPDYSNIPKAVLENAAAKGTALHKMIEDFDNGLPVQPTKGLEQYRKLVLNHIASEYLVTDGKLVASKIDMVYEVAPGEVEIADIKTTSRLHYRSLQWQLGIYKYLFERQNALRFSVCKCSVIQFDKNTGDFIAYKEIEPVTAGEVEGLLKAFAKGTDYHDTQILEASALEVIPETELVEYTGLLDKVAILKEAIDEVKVRCTEIEQKLLDYMVEKNIDTLVCPLGSFGLKKAYTRTTIDSARLKKDHPQIAEKYSKTSEVAPSITFKYL